MFRHCVPALLAAGLVPTSIASADLSTVLVDYSLFDGAPAPVGDGRLGPHEYGSDNSQFAAGAGLHTGMGGALGGSEARLYHAQSPLGLHLAFRPGAALGGTVVFFFDTRSGGRRAGSGPGLMPLDDTSDRARRAMSSLLGNYPSGGGFDPFTADAAITFNSDGAAVWRVPDGSSSLFTRVADGAAPAPGADAVFEALLSTSDFGSWGPRFFAAYVGDDGTLADEAFPVQPFSALGNPGVQVGAESPAEFEHFAVITSFIPAPGGAALGLAAAGLLARRPRRSVPRARAVAVL